MSDSLLRFERAQASGDYENALSEMKAGRKTSHWIWYVFPQIAGLGMSRMSQTYAIRDREEAAAYLRHPLLSSRLLEITTVAAEQVRNGVPLDELMGSPVDATKLVSSLTLFGRVAGGPNASESDGNARLAKLAEEILAAAASQGYLRCRHTLEKLGSEG
jgi:uncharacterized protein (DUF1810 family)